MTRIEQTVGMPYQDAVAYFEVIAALVDEHPAAADDMAVKPVVDIRCKLAGDVAVAREIDRQLAGRSAWATDPDRTVDVTQR